MPRTRFEERLAVVALGGNALHQAGEAGTNEQQCRHARETARAVSPLIRAGYRMVITHGNGPQVGNLMRKNEATRRYIPLMPLEILVANTQGALGHRIEIAFRSELERLRVKRDVMTVLAHVLVNPDHHAFERPTKPVGPFYPRSRARELMRHGWRMVEEGGKGWRRVVPSPPPVRILQEKVIRDAARRGTVVMTVGGGGIPVCRGPHGEIHGVEAVIDKDRASALLARRIGAGTFIILTEAKEVCLDFGKPTERPLRRVTLQEMARYHADGQFPPGSMGPKVEAALAYLRGGGAKVLIGRAEDTGAMLRGRAGTTIIRKGG